jgi:hypothetical protein
MSVMSRIRPVVTIVTAAAAVSAVLLATAPAGAAEPAAHPPTVLHVGQIDEQDIAPQPGSEPDTLVEPDIAVSPRDPRVAVAVAHDGRFPDGGAVDISYAWTHDGGRTWHHAPVPGITTAVGGIWDRASDPVLAFGPDGTLYLSVLAFDNTCPSGVTVSRSTDGGRTFGAPVTVHSSQTCDVSDDKNWLVVDNSWRSPHRGRVYQFWTAFLTLSDGSDGGSPQWLRYSDDHGRTWSDTAIVSGPHDATQNSQPMIHPDGSITDTYEFFPDGGGDEPEHTGSAAAARPKAAPAAEGDQVLARTSTDGGRTWRDEVTVTNDVGEGPSDIRCCLPSGTADPVTGELYLAWDSVTPNLVNISRSRDGRHWSAPIAVNAGAPATAQMVNVDVSAYAGQVFVSYGSRDTTVEAGRYVQTELASGRDAFGTVRFGRPLALGQRSDLRYAAFARGLFPGDYMGTAVTGGALYAVWARSSTPADPTATYHQVLDAASLRI